MGYTLFISPLTALAVVSQPVSTPVSIPISIPVPIPVIVPGAPEMVYPGNGQTLVLEDAYMFKVKPVTGASRYLFGFSQNGVMISENYSSNGEFAIWPNDPVHTQFQAGNVTVSIKALVNGNWTDAREITIILKSKIPAPTPTPEASPSASLLPAPEIVYPANGQTLILEDGYMFKVNLVEGASGYLYRLYQDNVLVFEDYNSNGESALWPDNPFHAQFHE